jgi:hypothetical protein
METISLKIQQDPHMYLGTKPMRGSSKKFVGCSEMEQISGNSREPRSRTMHMTGDETVPVA